MLGVLGWVFPELWRFPFPYFKALNPVEAHDYFVKTGGMSQILLFCAFAEVFGALALRETLDGDRDPGYFGFDPLGLGKDPAKWRQYQTAELKNGKNRKSVAAGRKRGNVRRFLPVYCNC